MNSNGGGSLSSIDHYQCILNRRQRGEKRPIPDEQKDEKYFERRKRNNEAAKKSRDARKMREDRVTIKNHSKSKYFFYLFKIKSKIFRLHFVQQFLNRKMPFYVHKY